MKILLLSDVHSNINALKAVEQQEKTWDMVLFAGDMVDFGLHPHEVVAWMQKNKAVAVAGNHDTALVKQWEQGFTPLASPYSANTFWQHNLSLLTREDLEYLKSLPLAVTLQADGVTYYMTHIYDETDGNALIHHLEQYHAIDSFESFWQKNVGKTKGKRVLVLGDTHHCMMVQLHKDSFVLNPGAVGYHLGADVAHKGATYIVIENGVPFFRFAEYSTKKEYQIVKENMTDLDEWQYQTGLAIFKS